MWTCGEGLDSLLILIIKSLKCDILYSSLWNNTAAGAIIGFLSNKLPDTVHGEE